MSDLLGLAFIFGAVFVTFALFAAALVAIQPTDKEQER